MWIDKIKEMTDSGQSFVLATVIRTQGSTPRGIGTRMIVTADGTLHGTIGGGDVENIVRNHAEEVLERKQPEILGFSLTGDTWQVAGTTVQGLCGGSLEVLLEPFVPDMELVIFGGGHIGHKLALLCEVMEMPCRVYDNREEFASPSRFPMARATILAPYDEIETRIRLTASSYCLILTHNHSHDHEVLKALLVQPQIPYIGMIGSRSKVGIIIEKIGEDGIFPDKRLYSPVGLDIGRRKPQDIALSIMAEILAVASGTRPDHCRMDWSAPR